MKQFLTVLNFEFKNYVKTKPFIITTVVFVLLIAGGLSTPRLISLFSSSGESKQQQEPSSVVFVSGDQAESVCNVLAASLPDYRFEVSQAGRDDLTAQVKSGDCNFGIFLESPLSVVYITGNTGLYDQTSTELSQALQAKYRADAMTEAGLSEQKTAEILSAQVSIDTVVTGKDQTKSFGYTYILLMLLYMSIVMYGGFVATSVVSEKNSRAMELLITSAKPVNFMFGKVFGAGLSALLQMFCIVGSFVVFYRVNASALSGIEFINSAFNMPLSVVGFAFITFILGFFMYAFLYAAMASLADRPEDVNTVITPVMLLSVGSFLIAMISMTSGLMDSPLLVFCSYFPLTAPMCMFVRVAMGSVSVLGMILSCAAQVITIFLLGMLATAIYRLGVLLYGKPPKLSAVFKMLRNQ